MIKVLESDLLVFQFPLWWHSMPAIMKGWIDRVFAYGVIYGPDISMKGKKAMAVVSTGGPEPRFVPEIKGTISQNLHSLFTGTLAFCGFEVLPPFVAYSAARVSDEARSEILATYRKHILAIPTMKPLELLTSQPHNVQSKI